VKWAQNYINFWELLAGRGGSGYGGIGIPIGPGTVSAGTPPGSGGSPGTGTTGGLGSVNGLANFGLADDTVGNDVATRLPPVLFDGLMDSGFLTADTLPTTADTIIDILYNPQGQPALGWYSLFPPPGSSPLLITTQTPAQRLALSPNYPVFPLLNPSSFNIFLFSFPGGLSNVSAGDILRIDCLQSGGAKNLLAVAAWIPKRSAGPAGQLNFNGPGVTGITLISP